MQMVKALMQIQRPSRTRATLHNIATTFLMHVMVGGRIPQFKMPRRDAY